MDLEQQIESYRFWDIVKLWGREMLQHEILVAKRLAQGVVCEGLRVQSVDPRWVGGGTCMVLHLLGMWQSLDTCLSLFGHQHSSTFWPFRRE